MRSRVFLFVAVLAALVGLGPATAMDVQPVVNVIRLPDDARGITLAISNPRNVDLPVMFDIVERDVADDGSETQTPADDEFLIFPAQTILQPGQTQSVRVQYVGEPPAESRSFTLFSTEVPVDFSAQGNSGVQRILRIGASVHVAPAGTEPRPVLLASEPAENGVRVTIKNEGTRFLYIDNLSLRFGETVLDGLALGNIAGRTLIPPGKTRSFVVPDVTGTPTLKLVTPYL